MGEMERIKAIIAKKKAEKDKKEAERIAKRKKERERARIFEIAGDERAPVKYRQAYIAKKAAIEKEEREKEDQIKIKEAKKRELEDYFKKASERRRIRVERLREKYGKVKK